MQISNIFRQSYLYESYTGTLYRAKHISQLLILKILFNNYDKLFLNSKNNKKSIQF